MDGLVIAGPTVGSTNVCELLNSMVGGVGGPSVSAAFRIIQELESRSSEFENSHPVQQKVAQVIKNDRH